MPSRLPDRSERLLMRHAADRLSVRYLGYDLAEPLPHHSSLTKIRTRYGLEVFRRFFEAIVEQCQEAGLVWGRELVRPVVIRGIPFTERRGSEQTTSGSWTDLAAKAKGDKSMSQKRETDRRYGRTWSRKIRAIWEGWAC
jgi:hypothetical protein